MAKTELPKNAALLYRRLITYALPYRKIFAFSVLAMSAVAALDPVKAYILKPLMDGGFIEKDPEIIAWLPYAIIGIFLVGGLARFVAQFSMAWIGARIMFDIRNEMFTHLCRLPAAYYDQNVSGRLMSKVIYDVQQISNATTKALFVVIKDGLSVIWLLGYMVYMNWKLTLLFLIIAPLVGGFVRFVSKRFFKTGLGLQKSMGGISGVVQELTEGHLTVKAYGAEEQESKQFGSVNDKYRRQMVRRASLVALSVPMMEFLAAIGMAVVVHYALNQAASGTLTIGEAISYFGAMMLMLGPVKRLTKVNEVIQLGLAAAHSVFELIDEETEKNAGTIKMQQVDGRVEYNNVSVAYSDDGEVVSDISFTINPGEVVALVGASGSGKSTLANLLARFYLPSKGSISVDGVDITDFDLNNLRSHISFVSQDTVLFNDSIKNNIAYGSADQIDDDRIRKAAAAAHVLEFVDDYENGFDTEVGEKGTRLSGGQRQRIAIARAIYKASPILILDEATSALDTESERLIQDALKVLMRDRTTLVIAHRLSTIEHANRILVLDKGRIVESGTHKELLVHSGVYARLYQNQFRT
ncbi:MAG: lipid A export permease/ATP-binding protein MsbA [Gammaproteobacteria bacterium]|nr:lipid A export permease/ATP-binding protein MsbA [Gammaproteobacteria bacterium]